MKVLFFYHEGHEGSEETVNVKQGFLINFNVSILKEGLKSFVL
jgi:hypothetical protein